MGLSIDTGIAPGAYGTAGANTVAQTQTAATAKGNSAAALQPAAQPVLENQAAEVAKPREAVKPGGGTFAKHRDAVTITYDSQAGVTVLKSFDSKGNVVTQVPPAQLLKTMELEGKSLEEIKGQVINTKA
jgi:hypothetical protein